MTEEKQVKKKFGIIVSGGPAPGINCVIAASVIEANNSGYDVIGFRNGFKGASSGDRNSAIPLSTAVVSKISNSGGSILGTSRYNPLGDPEARERLLEAFRVNNVDKLIVIGGEGSAYLSYRLSQETDAVRVVHVPKTIDNDLVLPNNQPSFGFETARFVGTRTIETLRADAKTCNRWYLAITMGRQAGFLALGIGISSEATITLIPEEFSDGFYSPEDVARVIFRSIKKRAEVGKHYGVAILAEGILDRFDPDATAELKDCPRDELGRITYSEIELGEVVLPHLRKMCREAGLDTVIKTKDIGYELRCAPPIPYDLEYTKFLGFGAVRLLLDGHRAVMVTRDYDNLSFQSLESMADDGKIISRTVNLTSDFYVVGRSFMIR
jgi:6-phosphofructokinase 1